MRARPPSPLALLLSCLALSGSVPAPLSVAPLRPSVPAPSPQRCPALAPPLAPAPALPLEEATPEAERACTPASPSHADALRRLEALGLALGALAPGADLGAVRAQLGALLSHPCLARRGLFSELPRAASAQGLSRWWSEGGRLWLEALVEQGSRGTRTEPAGQLLFFPPTERSVLSLETHGATALAPVLCPAQDARCGVESLPFLARMQQHLRAADLEERLRFAEGGPLLEGDLAGASQAESLCAQARSLDEWAFCVDEHLRPRATRMPLGRFRLPQGSLAVLRAQGREAELGVFDLASGASWYAARAPADARDGALYRVRRGHLEARALQEATLALLLHREAQEDVREGVGRFVPSSARERAVGLELAGDAVVETLNAEGPTALRWSWYAGGCERARGAVERGAAQRPPERAALAMLEVAESGFDDARDPGPAPALRDAEDSAPSAQHTYEQAEAQRRALLRALR